MIYTCMILHGHLHLHTQHLYQPMITQMLMNEPMLESYIGVHLISTNGINPGSKDTTRLV